MARLGAAEFRSRLRRLSRSELAAFVAALWEARGRDVEREDGLVVANDPETGEQTVLHPVPARPSDRWLAPRERRRSAATAIVLGGARPPSWAQADDFRLVDGDDLRELLLYAVDRETRRALLAEHFDVDPSRDGSEATAGRERDAARAQASRFAIPGSRRSAAIVGVAVLVLVGLVVGAVGLGLGPFDVRPGGQTDTTGETPTAPSTQAAASYPPGLSATGVENPDALAAAHITNLSGYTYTMVFEYREVGENHTGTIRETTEVVADTRYARHLNRTGSFTGDPAAVTDPAVVRDAETFANGEFHYARVVTEDGVQYSRQQVYSGRFPVYDSRAAGFIQRTLAANETAVTGTFERDGRTFYRVRFSGDDRPAFRDVRGVALIDERGVVHLLRTQYRPAEHPSVTVTVMLRYTDFRTTELTEPDWLSDVSNESDGNDSSTPASTGPAAVGVAERPPWPALDVPHLDGRPAMALPGVVPGMEPSRTETFSAVRRLVADMTVREPGVMVRG